MAGVEWLSSEEQQTWRAVLNFSQVLDLVMDRQLQRDASMSASDYSVLVALSEGGGEGLRSRDLGAALGWDRSRVSHQARRMEARGLLRREACVDDGRGTVVILTEAGVDALRQAAPGHVDLVRRVLFDVLSADEVGKLYDILTRVIDRVDVVEGVSIHR